MVKRNNIKKIKHRVAAGLFCVILLFADVTSAGITALAREPELTAQMAAWQEAVEVGDDVTELASDKERSESEATISGRESSGDELEDSDVRNNEEEMQPLDEEGDGDEVQDPGEEGDDKEVQDSGEGRDEDEVQAPGEEGDEDEAQDSEREEDENEVQDPEGKGDENEAQGPEGKGDENEAQDADEEGSEEKMYAEWEDDAEEKDAIEEEDRIIDADINVEEQDIRILTDDASIIASGSYKENESDTAWSIDADGKLTVEGTGEFAAVSFGLDIGRAPWHSHAPKIKTAEIHVLGMMDVSGMFRDCINLTKVDFGDFDTANVTNMSYMFYNCKSLTSLDLSGFDVGNVTSMDNMLYGCSKLMTIYTPCNVNVSVALPTAKSSDKWYSADGGTWSVLPQNDKSNHSILLQKNKTPSVKAEELKVVKKLTAYMCFNEVNLDDLTVTYYDIGGNAHIIPKGSEELAGTEDSEDQEGYRIDLEEADGKEIDVRIPGKKILKVTYKELTAEVELTFTYDIEVSEDGEDRITIDVPQDVIYSGYPKVPVPTVARTADGAILTQGTDYTVIYKYNVDAGDEAELIVVGQNDYNGEVRATFSIKPARLIVQAEDVTLAVGDELPDEFPYEAVGLSLGDALVVTGYSFTNQQGGTVTNIDTANTGIYYVTVVVDADEAAGPNYDIESRKGKLTIAEERIGYAVTFDMMGHGENIETPGIIKAGSLLNIEELNEQWDTDIPIERDGGLVTDESGRYVFIGWYKDKTFAAKQKWNFDADTVQADITLYACWIEKPAEEGSELQLSIQDIQYQYYTGSAIKPEVYVYAADGKTLLKSGTDYTISYVNNTNAVQRDEKGNLPVIGTASVTNAGKRTEEIESVSGKFNKEYPYIIITGKGNYAETIYKNFYILPADIADRNIAPAEGFTLKYSDQLVTNAKKDQNPFGSLKYKKAMVLGKDYRIILKAESDVKCDESIILEEGVNPSGWSSETRYDEKTKKYTAPVIPRGYSGTFTMTVEGAGNYTGVFQKTVVVADKNHLVKNLSVTLGKNQKSLAYREGKALTLQPGYAEAVTVDRKKQTLYYSVEKSGAKNPVTNANDIFLVKVGGTYLIYGKDYSVSYTNNNKVGTAAMTITGMGDYMGTKNVAFKITGTAFNTKNVIVTTYDANKPEEKVGCFMPSMTYTGKEITQSKVILTPKATAANADLSPLIYGIHYTISYKNNIKKGTANVTFTAKPESGYTGSFNKTFKITAANLATPNTITVKAVNESGQEEYRVEEQSDENGNVASYRLIGDIAYVKGGVKPSDKIRIELINEDGEAGITLKEGTDFTVTYKNNEKTTVTALSSKDNKKPYMIIAGQGNYTGKLTVYFGIGKAELSEDQITISPIAWNQKAKDTYEYKPGVKVVDGMSGKILSIGNNKDCIIAYEYNDQVNVTRYVLGEEGAIQPVAVITVPEASSYKLADGDAVLENGEFKIKIPLPIYKTQLNRNNLYVIIIDAEQTIYTGEQLKPDVAVYYGGTEAVKKANKDKVEEEGTLTDKNGDYKLRKLIEKTTLSSDEIGDYTLSYGANAVAGKNKGSVTVTGASNEFGGSVTFKFEIVKKNIVTVVPVTSFVLNRTKIEGGEGAEEQLIAEDIRPIYATYSTIKWESVNPEIASVDADGVVSLNSAGMTVINAYADSWRFVAKCLVIVNSNEVETVPEGDYLTPQMYRTYKEDDDTEAFNRAIKNLNSECNTLYIPAGTYRIDAVKGIEINKSDIKFTMSPNAVLKAIGNSSVDYVILHVNGVANVTISGGRIVGERYEHSGSSGEWGHGIGVYGSKDINITGVDISDCWGDGVYLGSHNESNPDSGCDRITITDCALYNNRRNNLSIVCADNVKAERCKFNDANGTAPEFGIDIETNTSNPCKHIEIIDSTFDGNAQGSIEIVSAADDIRIYGCTLNGTFVNWAGTNVVIEDSVINGEADARIGVTLVDTKINDGGSEEDELVAEFNAARCPYPYDADTCPYTISKYEDDNVIFDVVEDSGSPSGKALYLKRESAGTREAGYYLDLGELTRDGSKVLKQGVTYRIEYYVNGSSNSQWGIKTDQTGWYQCVPMSDKYSTGIVTYKAGSAKSCRLLIYAEDKTKGMELKIDSIRIYKVR